MHISYKPLWHTLIERNMRKEDLRLAAGLTTNMIANMEKKGNISAWTLLPVFAKRWILRRGQNHREMPAGAAYHHKRQDNSRFSGIVSITLKCIFCKVYSLWKVIAV